MNSETNKGSPAPSEIDPEEYTSNDDEIMEDPNVSLPVIHPPTSTATPYQDNRSNESCVSNSTDTGDHESCNHHSHNEVIIIWYLLYFPIYNLVELLKEIFAFCYCHFCIFSFYSVRKHQIQIA